MTSVKVQPFCRKYNINIGCFDGTRINPGNITQRNTLKTHENHFCLIWKSDGISFNKAIKEVKDISKVVDIIISDKHVEKFFKHEHNPKKVKSPLINIVVYDLETFNKIRVVPYFSRIYTLAKSKYHQVNTIEIYQKKNIENVQLIELFSKELIVLLKF